MTNTTADITIQVINDAEGEGECSACGRTGLRWVADLSDGTRVGLECAKKVLGWKPAPKDYNWIADFRLVATHNDYSQVMGLWQHKSGTATRETRDGMLVAVGGIRARWERDGWI